MSFNAKITNIQSDMSSINIGKKPILSTERSLFPEDNVLLDVEISIRALVKPVLMFVSPVFQNLILAVITA